MPSTPLSELLKLPAETRAELAMALWASLSPEEREAELALTPGEEAELDRRWAEHLRNPSTAVPWKRFSGSCGAESCPVRCALVCLAGLLTVVPYGTYHLLFRAERDDYAFLIALVLFWVLGSGRRGRAHHRDKGAASLSFPGAFARGAYRLTGAARDGRWSGRRG